MAGDSSWLIYALGGGWGHLTRAVSLAQAAEPHHKVRILTNSPYVAPVWKTMPELDLISLDPKLDFATARDRTIQQIVIADAVCLIVDTFPRGLGGELAPLFKSLRAIRVLVHRDLSPRYVAQGGLRNFVRSAYDLVLIPGEDEATAFASLPLAVVTAPWLVRNPPRNRKPRRRRRILVCASGYANELPWYAAVVSCLRALDSNVDVRCVAPVCPPGCPREYWVAHWPASDLFAAADVVIGGAGYNTIRECVAGQVPLIARPWPRKYDRQWLRAQRAAKTGGVTIVQEPTEAARAAIDQIKRARPPQARTEVRNGAAEAVDIIESVMENRVARVGQ